MFPTRCVCVALLSFTWAASWQAHALADFDIVIVSGLPTPDGNGSLSLPNAPAINAAGHLSFVSQLTGTAGGTADNSGLYRYDTGGLTQIARRGEPLIGRTISFILSSNIDQSGNVFAIPALTGPPTLIWYLIGDGGPIASPFTLGSPSPSGNNTLLGVTTTAVNDAGVTTFQAVYNGASPEAGIYLRATDGSITTLLKRQSPAPRGGTISSTGTRLALNELAEVAALLTVDSSVQSIARVDSSGAHELVREGDVLTDGVTTITQISTSSSSSLDPIPLINDAGQIAFPAQYSQPASRLGVFLADDAGVRLLTPDVLPGASGFATSLDVMGISNAGEVAIRAQSGFGGDPLSGLYIADEFGVELVAIEDSATPVPGKFFRDIPSSAISMNAAGQVAFLAELSDSANGAVAGWGMFFYDSQNGLQQVLRTGDSLGGSTVTNLFFRGTLLGAISNQSPDTSLSGLNAAGEVAFAFDLANGQSGLATWSASATVDGDFDGDGDVDGRDFLLWQRNPSVGNLADWQMNYGNGSLATILVLEPTSALLVTLGAIVAGFKRGRTL